MEYDTATFEDVKAVRDSGKALLCLIEGTGVWIPKSLIEDDSEVYRKGDEGTLIVPEWFAVKEGLV